MDDVIFYPVMAVITVLFILAIIGFGYLGLKRDGLYINNEADDVLDDLWIYAKKKFFMHLLKEKEAETARREMKPCIIAVALKLAQNQLETKGQDSEIYRLMEKEAWIVTQSNEKLRPQEKV